MTLAALLLRDRFFNAGLSNRLKYATIGVLARFALRRYLDSSLYTGEPKA